MQPHCVIDIEASGFGARSYPIEVGFVRADGRAFCTLVRPQPHWTHWDAAAQKVHGISRETLLRHGRAVAEVVQRLDDDLAGLTVYCDGWAHDFPWLAALYEEVNRSPGFRLQSVNMLLDDTLREKLPQARREALAALGLSRHRASSDARALQWALQRLSNGA
jgi:DNA polymerase III epsilon subunit-like protein